MRKPSILVPYPHAAEDHQTVNARVLVDRGAAILVSDDEADRILVQTILDLVANEESCKQFALAAGSLSTEQADHIIAEKIINTLENA